MSAISTFQFTPPLLIESSFSMKRPPRPKDPVNIHLCRNINKKNGENQAIVELKVQLNKHEDQEDKDPCFVAEVTMQSLFSWADDMDPGTADELLRINAPALLVSYIRPVFVQLTSMSPVETYNLPFLNMHELFKDEQAK